LRIYNKDKQSQDSRYERSWRYEVVYRNKYANNVFRYVIAALDAYPTVILSHVVAYCAERGINILGMGDSAGNPIEVPKSAPTDVQRKLRWIKQQVVPTIRKLAEMGYAEQLMEEIAEAIAAARNSQL
jgi:DNA relaxase NicK